MQCLIKENRCARDGGVYVPRRPSQVCAHCHPEDCLYTSGVVSTRTEPTHPNVGHDLYPREHSVGIERIIPEANQMIYHFAPTRTFAQHKQRTRYSNNTQTPPQPIFHAAYSSKIVQKPPTHLPASLNQQKRQKRSLGYTHTQQQRIETVIISTNSPPHSSPH